MVRLRQPLRKGLQCGPWARQPHLKLPGCSAVRAEAPRMCRSACLRRRVRSCRSGSCRRACTRSARSCTASIQVCALDSMARHTSSAPSCACEGCSSAAADWRHAQPQDGILGCKACQVLWTGACACADGEGSGAVPETRDSPIDIVINPAGDEIRSIRRHAPLRPGSVSQLPAALCACSNSL